MSEPASTSRKCTPPRLNVDIPSMKEIQTTTRCSTDAYLPVDVLLATIEECEFEACYLQLKNPYKCWFDRLGYVYFGDAEEDGGQEEKVKVALLNCCECKRSFGPAYSSRITINNALNVLRPKGVISVGICSGLNPNKSSLGDVVLSKIVTTQSHGMRSYVSRGFRNILWGAAHGWEPPLNSPGSQEIKVHCDGEFLTGPEQICVEWRRKEVSELHPKAIAIETEGEGELVFFCVILRY